MKKTQLFRTNVISILLAALVVFCPFQCILSSCMSSGSDLGTVSATSCCGHCSQPAGDGEHGSELPADCNCGDCFCRGALPVEDVSQDLVFVDLVTFITTWVNLDAAPVATPSGQLIRHSSALPIDASALEVRASLCCWVI